MTVAPRQLNTDVCTLQDVAGTLQVQNELNNFFYEVINGGGVSDTYKVKIDDDDVAPDFLHAKMNDTGSYDVDSMILVRAESVSDATERYFWQASDVSGFSAGTLQVLYKDVSDALVFGDPSVSTDSNKVLCTSGDLTANYLHDSLNLAATYVGGADILVATATVGGGGTDQTERLFVDASAISGWAGTGDFFLGMHNNAVSWMTFSDIVSGGISVGYALDVSGATVSFDPTEITGFTSEFQFFMHLASASAATDPAWKSVTGYDATKKQIQWHQSGSFSFNTVTNYDTATTQHLSHINGTWQFLGALRFAITTAAIPAATGNYNGAITPGTTVGNNIQLYDFGATYGASAAQAGAAQAENYMRAAVAIHKPIFVFERAPGIWVVPAEGCTAVPAS